MFRYLKEIVNAKRQNRSLPSFDALMRYYKRWANTQQKDVFQVKYPWITFSAIDYLQAYLKSDMRVFEFGGGGSTAFFSSTVSEVVTVEHNEEWFSALTKQMAGKKGWTSFLAQPDPEKPANGLRRERPEDYLSDEGQTYRRYATTIAQFPDNHFDVVLVDGRARPSCLFHSLKKVKVNGLLILDNADRTYYLEDFGGRMNNYHLELSATGPAPYSPWFTQTNIWKRLS